MIDRATIERIKGAANIVEVVSEFVTLRRSGSNYKGLCPFHNEKTPSFIVSPSRGTCHCFGCGKGGNAVSFIMEHEQMTYPEALRWLAKKYNIEIHERELSPEEKREESERESMFIVNEWAAKYFQNILQNHPDGVAIGKQYFRSRGIRDDIIEKFRLGFDLSDRHALARTAQKEGYKGEFLQKTGLCYMNDRGELIDRYANRVMFPWVGVSGKVVGFGGRLLDARTKGVNQKYVNSPDSDIFHKDRELYGIWQAKRAIAKEDRVYMVEGYTDVIAMHQCGIENVVANSGTALSTHQIHILHRFTSNITLLYDGDAAGIHAALRGTDMLLAEGMNLKVLLLPDGDDPDSFARKHTAADFRKYIEDNQTDFIQFKTRLLLQNERDPLKRSEAINSIVKSISVIQNPILRDTYLHDCATQIGMSETTLINQANRLIREGRGQTSAQQAPKPIQQAPPVSPTAQQQAAQKSKSQVEDMIIQMVMKYGEAIILENYEDEDGVTYNISLAQFVSSNLEVDDLKLSNPLYNRILEEAVSHNSDDNFKAETYFLNHDDVEISQLANRLCQERFQLSESRMPIINAETLMQRIQHLLLDFRFEWIENHIRNVKAELNTIKDDTQRRRELMEDLMDKMKIRKELAKLLGKNLVI